ncbi:hypothetical protein H7F51_04200 [Novosphingobium flavum]|uniref:Protein TonB n=1 Tax=Novosphingobium flavum TaxID=1778672 RepID=A0A7X1FQU1_9SPHN|nr:hypothetical protein [Novosphingobium flavum]MBC2664717.1 hypothetical protein [Novosphingobium flavum]
MEQPSTEPEHGRYGTSKRNRPVALALSAIVCALLFATMLAMGSFDAPGGRAGGNLVAISISQENSKPKAAHAKARQQVANQAVAVAETRTAVIPPAIVPTKNTYQLPEGFIQLSKADMAKSDIGSMHSAPSGAAAGSGSGSGDGSADGTGQGPGGAKLYNAEWYREPRDAELAGYIQPGHAPGEWAMIACRTIDHYHVEDCRELDESPRGSGMARALRQAAWQFLVRPPRVDGKPMLGTWVRIRFDFTRGKRSSDDG